MIKKGQMGTLNVEYKNMPAQQQRQQKDVHITYLHTGCTGYIGGSLAAP